MKKQTFHYFIMAALFLAAAFTSCVNRGSGSARLLEGIVSDIETVKFEYDDKDRIVKMYSYRHGELQSTSTLSYSGNNPVKLTNKYEWGESSTYFGRNGDTITVSGDEWNQVLTVNAAGYIAAVTQQEPGEYSETVNIYSAGNLIKQTTAVVFDYAPGEKNESFSEYRYDDMKSPFFYCMTGKWFLQWYLEFGYENNVTFSRNSIVDLEFAYEYDNDGFPVKRTRIMANGGIVEYSTSHFFYRGETHSIHAETGSEETAVETAGDLMPDDDDEIIFINYASFINPDALGGVGHDIIRENGESFYIRVPDSFKDGCYISIGYNDDNKLYSDSVLLSLAAAQEFIIVDSPSETIPNRGISFTDKKGVRRYFYISFSGENNSVSLNEFEGI